MGLLLTIRILLLTIGFLLIKLIAFSDFNIPCSTSWTHKNVFRCKKAHIWLDTKIKFEQGRLRLLWRESCFWLSLKSVKNTLIKGAISFAIKRMSKGNFWINKALPYKTIQLNHWVLQVFIVWVRAACSRLSDSGEDAKEKGTRKVGVLLSCLRFLNSVHPTISEPWTGLSPRSRHIAICNKSLRFFEVLRQSNF